MSEICRLCLECTKKKGVGIDYKDSNNFSVLTALNLVIPEFQSSCPKDSKICMQCYPLLLLSYKFRSKCLNTEDIIAKYLKEYNYNPETVSLNQVVEWNRNCIINNILEQVTSDSGVSSESPIKDIPEDQPDEKNNPSEETECQPPDIKPRLDVPDKSVDSVSVRPLLKTYSKKNNSRLKSGSDKSEPAQTNDKIITKKTKIKRNLEELEVNTSSQETNENGNENTTYSIDSLISPNIEMDTDYPLMGDFTKCNKKPVGCVVKKRKNKQTFDYEDLDNSNISKPKNNKIPPPIPASSETLQPLNEVEQKKNNVGTVKKLKIANKIEPDAKKPASPSKSPPKLDATVSTPKAATIPVVKVRPVEVLNNLSITSKGIQECLVESPRILESNFNIENVTIKEEPLDYDENSYQTENQMPSLTPYYESGSGNWEVNQNSLTNERSTEQIVEGLINNLPEVGQEFDRPEYISINKVSYRDMALLFQTAVKTRPTKSRIVNRRRIANPNTLKRLRLVPIDHPKKDQVKRLRTAKAVENKKPKPKTQKASTDAEKDVCVLVTNFTSTGDYINDHDYLINPYERNNILRQIDGRPFCVCLLCNSVHNSEGHVKHMQTHSSVCEVCGVDFHNVFILNMHVQTHTILCGNCNVKITYRMHKNHKNCRPPSTSGMTNTACSDANKEKDTTKKSSQRQEKNEKTGKPDDTNGGLRRSSRLKRTKRKVYSINSRMIEEEKRRQKFIASELGMKARDERPREARPRTVIRKNNSQVISQSALSQQYIFNSEQASNRLNLPGTSGMVPKVTWLQPVKFKKTVKLKKVKKSSPDDSAVVRIPEQRRLPGPSQTPPNKPVKKFVIASPPGNQILEMKNTEVQASSHSTGGLIRGFGGSVNQFKQYFRMNRSTFQNLMGKMYAALPNPSDVNYSTLEKEVLVCLWYLGTTESLKAVAARFNSVSFSWETLLTIGYMISDLNRKTGIISWPSREEAANIMKQFEKVSGVPGVIGCIKGLHIKIPAYRNTKVYISNKMFDSVYLQGVCDHRRAFTDIYLSQNGSLHTSTLFSRSDLGCKPLKYRFPAGSHIVGNKDFKLEKYVMVDFTENVDNKKRAFNQKLWETRTIVDQAFALLRGRFTRLKYMDTRKVYVILVITNMACILHNVCIANDDKPEGILNLKTEMRDLNLDYINPGPIEDTEVSAGAEEKRHALMCEMF
ncbi:uncharacterized protein LOC143192369 [Rhynchophorus ferrugineus]|uniref:uncharacterized protein LOC143192369 n=1 Tax=Rhynchophorus ferrugineus TaxID=354439 RepID=UPI003FCE257F